MAEGKAELYICLNLTRMQCRIEQPEFNGSLRECCMEV